MRNLKRCHLHLHCIQPLFWNCTFHLVGIFSSPCPPRADICDLIRFVHARKGCAHAVCNIRSNIPVRFVAACSIGDGILLDDLSEFLRQHKRRTDIKHVIVCDSQRSPPGTIYVLTPSIHAALLLKWRVMFTCLYFPVKR